MVEAFDEFDAANRVKQTCKVILKLTPVREKAPGLLSMEIGGNKLNIKALSVVCSQFAIILKAGIPIARCTQLVADKTTDKPLKKVLVQVAEDVETGRSLAASFAERGKNLLPPTFIETIRSGEESGNLDQSFETMQRHYTRSTENAGKVKGALAYPLFVMVIAVAVIIVLNVVVLPKLLPIFDSYDAQLPLPTLILVAVSGFFQNHWMLLLGVIAVLVIAFKMYSSTESGRLNVAKLQLRLPVLGNIAGLNAASQFANTMATMLGAGLPITKALSITAKTLDNYYMSQEMGKLSSKLEEGHNLGPSMQESGCMPDILNDMVAVGEATGELEETLRTVGDYYDYELNDAIQSALKKLEPATLVIMAGVAGFIVVAIYLGIFTLYSAM